MRASGCSVAHLIVVFVDVLVHVMNHVIVSVEQDPFVRQVIQVIEFVDECLFIDQGKDFGDVGTYLYLTMQILQVLHISKVIVHQFNVLGLEFVSQQQVEHLLGQRVH